MNFDWGGFSGGIIGTIGAFVVALFTLRHQTKNKIPVVNKRKYRLVIDVFGILRKVRTDIFYLPGQGMTLVSLTVKAMKSQFELEKLLPEAIEIDMQLHDAIKHITEHIFGLNAKYFEFTQRSLQSNQDEEIILKYISEFNYIISLHVEKFGELRNDIVKQAGTS